MCRIVQVSGGALFQNVQWFQDQRPTVFCIKYDHGMIQKCFSVSIRHHTFLRFCNLENACCVTVSQCGFDKICVTFRVCSVNSHLRDFTRAWLNPVVQSSSALMNLAKHRGRSWYELCVVRKWWRIIILWVLELPREVAWDESPFMASDWVYYCCFVLLLIVFVHKLLFNLYIYI